MTRTQAPQTSWWVALTRDQFMTRRQVAQARMDELTRASIADGGEVEMLDARWTGNGARALRLDELMRSGVWPGDLAVPVQDGR